MFILDHNTLFGVYGKARITGTSGNKKEHYSMYLSDRFQHLYRTSWAGFHMGGRIVLGFPPSSLSPSFPQNFRLKYCTLVESRNETRFFPLGKKLFLYETRVGMVASGFWQNVLLECNYPGLPWLW